MQSRRPNPPLTDLRLAGIPAVVIAAIVIAVDQVTKTWALSDRLTYPGIHLFGDVRLARTLNTGVAFGIGGGSAPILIGIAILGALLVAFNRQLPINRWVIAGLGLVLGGGLSNVADRVIRNHHGAVIDFIDIGELPVIHHNWPVFNVADACIVVGAIIIALFGSRATPLEEEQ